MPISVRARPDTRLLLETSLTDDLGQRLTNLTSAAPGSREANSARTALTGAGSGRSFELTVQMDNASTGVLLDHDDGISYRITVATPGAIAFSNSDGTIMSLTASAIDAAPKTYVIAWSTEPNPGGSPGGSDELRSEFLVYDVAVGGSPVWDTATHKNIAASSTATLTVGGVYTGGAMTLAYSDTISVVRISSRFHTRTETREHFVAQTAAPTLEGPAACQRLPLPAAVLTNGNVVGPAYQLGAASMQTKRDRHRLLSPVEQWMNASPPTLSDDMRDTVNPKHVLNMGDGWQQPLMWLCWRPFPRHCTHVRVEVQWATWETVPGATDIVELRAHSWNANPYYATEDSNVLISRTSDDGVNGLGVRQVFPPLLVKRGDDGYTWLGLSGRTDSGSGSGNASYLVRSFTAVPWVLGDGYDGGQPNGWGP
jgi:hypothetical protein